MTSYERVGSELTVNTTYARTQAQAEVAQLADGRFIVTWIDADFNTTAGRCVRAQIYEANGTPSGGELTLSGSLNGAIQPAITGPAGGGFVAAWDGFFSDMVQVFDSSGAPAGAAFALPTGTEGDKFSLVDLDANALVDGDQAFTFIGSAAFSGVAGQLRYWKQDGDTYIWGDVDGDAVADFQIVVDPLVNLVASDFIL
jgi:hypothetical protein